MGWKKCDGWGGPVHGSGNFWHGLFTATRHQRAEVGARQLLAEGPPTVIHLCQQDHGHKSFTSPSSATPWVPSVQTHLPMGDLLSPNYSSGPALPLL